METLIAAVFVLFLMLFAGLSLSQSSMSAQQTMQSAVVEMQDRHELQMGTQLTPLEAHTTDFGATIVLTIANTGAQPIMDFDKWDVIVHYSDDLTSFHIDWLPNGSAADAWTLGTIRMNVDSATPIPEIYNRNILDPGEMVTLTVQVSPPVDAGTGIVVRVSAPNGSSSTTMLTSNYPPEVVLHTGSTMITGSTVTITNAELRTTDLDGEEITYTIVNPPTLGALNFMDSFTQADIDAGRLTYTNNGTAGFDAFNFTVTDGKDTVAMPFSLTIIEPTPAP